MTARGITTLKTRALGFALLAAGASACPAQALPTDAPAATAVQPKVGEVIVDQPLHGAAVTPNAAPSGRSARAKSRYRVELGVTPRYISNYFEAQDTFNTGATPTPKKGVFITTLSAKVEYDLIQQKQSTLIAGMRVRRNIFTNLAGADSTDLDVGITYNAQPNLLRASFVRTPRRLVSVLSDGKVYGETNGFSAEYVRQLSHRWQARGSYQFARQTFSRFKERDLSVQRLSGDVRYRISRYLTPGLGLEYERGTAESENFSYNRPAIFAVATSEIGRAVYASVRYRVSRRTYPTDIATDSNFGRDDHRHDISSYANVKLGKGFSMLGFASRIVNSSNRPSSSFKSYEAGLGLFYGLP